MRILSAIMTLLFLVPATSQADEKAELKKLAGNYKTIAMKLGGKNSLPSGLKFKITKLTVEKNQFILTISINGQERKRPTTVKIDGSKTPKQIDFLKEDGTVISLGIYKLEGEKLTVCSQSKSEGRPKKFESKAGSKSMVLIFERVKQ